MSRRAKLVAAQILVPIAGLIAVAGAVVGNCFVVCGMGLVTISQIVNYRCNRDRL